MAMPARIAPVAKLQFAEVALGEHDRPAVGRSRPPQANRNATCPSCKTMPLGQVGEHAGRELVGRLQPALRRQQPVAEQFGRHVDQARAAKPHRRHVADHVDAQAAVDDDLLDRAGAAAHAAGDSRALEGRARPRSRPP